MKRISILAVSLALAALFAGCYTNVNWFGGQTYRGDGNVTTEEYTIDGETHSLSLQVPTNVVGGAGLELRFVPGDKVTVRTDANLQSLFKPSESANRLSMGTLRDRYRFTTLEIEVGCDSGWESIELAGGMKCSNTQVLLADCLELRVDGAIDGDLAVQARELRAWVNGAADLDLVGEAEELALSVNGAVQIGAKGLETKKADVTLNGAGNCELSVSDELTARINGAGSVAYWGDPVVDKKIAGIGSITKK